MSYWKFSTHRMWDFDKAANRHSGELVTLYFFIVSHPPLTAPLAQPGIRGPATGIDRDRGAQQSSR